MTAARAGCAAADAPGVSTGPNRSSSGPAGESIVVSGNNIPAGPDEVLEKRNHATMARLVASNGAIYDRNSRVDFLLNGQQIDQCLVNERWVFQCRLSKRRLPP